jgi:hypothetical protein
VQLAPLQAQMDALHAHEPVVWQVMLHVLPVHVQSLSPVHVRLHPPFVT